MLVPPRTPSTARRAGKLQYSGSTLYLHNGSTAGGVAISGGGGGGNAVRASVDFGSSWTDRASTVVTGQSWVESTSSIVAQVLTGSGVDPDEIRLLEIDAQISDLVAGTGFTVTLTSAPECRGTYTVMCLGV